MALSEDCVNVLDTILGELVDITETTPFSYDGISIYITRSDRMDREAIKYPITGDHIYILTIVNDTDRSFIESVYYVMQHTEYIHVFAMLLVTSIGVAAHGRSKTTGRFKLIGNRPTIFNNSFDVLNRIRDTMHANAEVRANMTTEAVISLASNIDNFQSEQRQLVRVLLATNDELATVLEDLRRSGEIRDVTLHKIERNQPELGSSIKQFNRLSQLLGTDAMKEFMKGNPEIYKQLQSLAEEQFSKGEIGTDEYLRIKHAKLLTMNRNYSLDQTKSQRRLTKKPLIPLN